MKNYIISALLALIITFVTLRIAPGVLPENRVIKIEDISNTPVKGAGLIEVNTAIASPTGAYACYGFAVPSNLINKVVEDLFKYGVVQRGFLGVIIRGVDGNLVKEKDLAANNGIYVDSVVANRAAEDAGIKAGDVILEVNGENGESAPEL